MKFIVQLMEMFYAWACLLPAVLLLCGILWLTLPKQKRQLLPPQRLRFAPWWAPLEILGVIAIILVAMSFVGGVWNEIAGEPAASAKAFRQNAVVLTSFPLILVFSWVLLHFAGNNLPLQIGVHAVRWRQFTILGGLAFLVTTPAVLLVNYLVALLVEVLLLSPPSHSLTEVVRGVNPALEWAVVLLCALVAAPVMEEFLYRGVVQRWTVQNNAGSMGIFVLAAVFTVLNSGEYKLDSSFFVTVLFLSYLVVPLFCGTLRKRNALAKNYQPQRRDNPQLYNDKNKTSNKIEKDSWGSFDSADHPVFREIERFMFVRLDFLDPLCPNFDLTGRNGTAVRIRGIIAPALLFAGMHPWPTPIPLFVLGLVLGWLAYRTQSLVAPFVVHLLFNGVACIHLAMDLQQTAAP